MRLKGGKVLIDCSDYTTDATLYEKTLDLATTKAILDKGISIVVTEYVENIKVCIDLIPVVLHDAEISYLTFKNDDDKEITPILQLTLTEGKLTGSIFKILK